MEKLSDREIEVLKLYAKGFGKQEIAWKLLIQPKTVNSHIQHIREKLCVHKIYYAILYALKNGIIGLEDL